MKKVSEQIPAHENGDNVGQNNTRQANVEGLKTLQSRFDSKETITRLEAEIKAHGMGVFARIDHAALAAEAGLMLRPTEVILFGNPRGGTPLMQANQTVGIDLPLKVLVWQDALGTTWLSWNEPAWVAERHELGGAYRSIGAMTVAVGDIALKATGATGKDEFVKR